MSQKLVTKNGKRFVLYISRELRNEITECVNQDGTTLADFAREAFEQCLKNRRQEEQKKQLAEACLMFRDFDMQQLKNWSTTEAEGWPV
ncbi:MAG: hypothetical protein DWQ05_21100 [Calditrichaeota bacterium]|nr:MAG: hypothetical protein DWQ05_21100 [Calditrichota bacterium]